MGRSFQALPVSGASHGFVTASAQPPPSLSLAISLCLCIANIRLLSLKGHLSLASRPILTHGYLTLCCLPLCHLRRPHFQLSPHSEFLGRYDNSPEVSWRLRSQGESDPVHMLIPPQPASKSGFKIKTLVAWASPARQAPQQSQASRTTLCHTAEPGRHGYRTRATLGASGNSAAGSSDSVCSLRRGMSR